MNTRLVTDAGGRAVGAGESRESCAHCGQSKGNESTGSESASDDVSAGPWFCCAGCRSVHRLLLETGLGEYYAFRERQGELAAPVQAAVVPSGAFAEFDAPAFQRLYCEAQDGVVDRAELELGGLHCAACVWLVERLPRVEPAVRQARVDLGRGRVTLEFVARGPSGVPLSRVAGALARLGYKPRPLRGLDAERARQRELRGLLLRIGVAGASAGNVMLLAFALYGGADEVSGLPEEATMARATLRLLHGATWLVSLPALWAAGSFFRGALSSLKTRTPHMDLPIALGISAAFLWGTVSILQAGEGLYFDTITTLVFLLLIGRYLDTRHRQRHSQAAELLSAVLPGRARRLSRLGSSETEFVPVESLTPSDLILVQSGETLPADGVVRAGTSTLDLSLMSGESTPAPVSPGDTVVAGALNVGSELCIEVSKAGAETRVAALLRAVERSMTEKAPLLGFTNRMAGRFTWAVLASALVVFLLWAPRSLEAGWTHALSVLIVACPCALGMATPLALSSAVAKAARSGILVFGAGSLERLASPSLLVLDKTGTLTLGHLEVVGRWGSAALDPFVLALEAEVHHPVGRALARYLSVAGVQANADVHEVREVLGSGLCARGPAGELTIGSAAFVLGRARASVELARLLEGSSGTESVVLVALDESVQAAFFLADEIRPDAAPSLRRLAAMGHELCILSGDAEGPVQHVARELGRTAGVPFAHVLSGVSPEQKLAHVRAWAADGPSVVMVGDGVNDAGALAAAHVGVAVGGAAEAARLSADVYLAHPGVAELERLMIGARRSLRIIQRGVGFSLCYNAVGVLLAACGLLSPLVAAVLMPLSSLTVVSHAFRSRSFEPRWVGETEK